MGVRGSMFRVGNRRGNIILEARLHLVAVTTTKTAEGEIFYRANDLPLIRDRQVGMTRGWTVMHVIDEASPLFGLDQKGLARALAIKPSILLLDEPFAALDKNLRLDMQIEVKRLQRGSGVTTLIVTHDQEEALSMADRVAVLSQGHLEQFSSPTDVYDKPQTLFVNTFVGSSNRMPGTLVSADATSAKVRLDAGAEIIARPASKSMAEGGRVTVCIRPEHLRFVTDDSGFAGVIGMALPLGATVVHEVTTADGSGVKVSQARLGETRLLENGVAVRVAPRAPALANVFPA